MCNYGSISTILYTFKQFWAFKTSTLEFLAENNKLLTYYRNWMSYEWQNYLSFFVNNYTVSSPQLKLNLEVSENKPTVHKFVQQCCLFQSAPGTSKWANLLLCTHRALLNNYANNTPKSHKFVVYRIRMFMSPSDIWSGRSKVDYYRKYASLI